MDDKKIESIFDRLLLVFICLFIIVQIFVIGFQQKKIINLSHENFINKMKFQIDSQIMSEPIEDSCRRCNMKQTIYLMHK